MRYDKSFWSLTLLLILMLCVMYLAGCQTARMPPPKEPEKVFIPGPSVPVPVPCSPKLVDDQGKSLKPDFEDTDDKLAAIPDVEAGARRYRAAILQYRFWTKTLEGAIEGCQRIP